MIRKLLFILIAACTLFSCGGNDPVTDDPIKPEQPQDPENPEKPENQTKQIKTMTVSSRSGYFVENNLSYDENNRISQIKSHVKSSYYKGQDVVTDFSYKNGLIMMETKHNGATDKLEMFLNRQGLVEKIKSAWGGWSTSAESFEYENDYLVKQKDVSEDSYVYRYMNGNLTSYSYFEDGIYESVYQITYTDKGNKLGVSPLLLRKYDKTIDIPLPFEDLDDHYLYYGFFCFYGGLFGKPSKNMEESVTWGGSPISYEYKFDQDGYPIEITSKYFNRDGEYILDNEESFTANIEYWEN